MNWQSLLPYIGDFFSNHAYLGIFFAGFIAFIESLAIVGSIIPGSIMMTIVGFLLGIGVLPLRLTLISIFIGAFVGDMVSYIIGAYYQDTFRNHDWVQPYHHWVAHGETFMKKYGAASIIIGRFFGPMRSLIPLIAGLAGMHIGYFTLAIIPTVILWAAVYLTPGALLGAVSIDMGESYFLHIISNLVLYLVLFGLWHSTQNILRFCNPLHRRFPNLNSETLTHIIKAVLLIVFASILIYQQYHFPPEENWLNVAAYHYSLIHSSNFNIEIAQLISLCTGHITYILMNIAAVMVLYFHYHKRFALLWATSSAGLFFLTYLLKYNLMVSRPNPLLDATGFPSGHILLFITFVLCFSVLIENCALIFAIILRRIGFAAIGIITISRLILQAHWFLDLIASAFIACAIWHLVSIWKHRIPRIPMPHIRQIGSAILLILIPFTTIYRELPSEIRPHIPQALEINHLQELDKIPTVRYSRLGQVVAPINFIFTGNLIELKTFFEKEGFLEYPSSGSFSERIKTLFHYSEYHSILPVLPPLFEQRGPDIIFGKTDKTHAYIVKLWHLKGRVSVYIGTASLETYPESFFSPNLILCQKERFNVKQIFNDKHHLKHSKPLEINLSKNAFCWNGEIFYKD